MLVVKRSFEDTKLSINTKKKPNIRVILVAERLSNDLYEQLIVASRFFVTGGDNVLMDAFSLGTWPLHLFHNRVCKKRETMFPVCKRYCEEMTRQGNEAGFEIMLCINALKKLGTNNLPSDEELKFYQEIVCPYIRNNFDYGKKIHEDYMKGNKLIELNRIALGIELS